MWPFLESSSESDANFCDLKTTNFHGNYRLFQRVQRICRNQPTNLVSLIPIKAHAQIDFKGNFEDRCARHAFTYFN